MSPAVAGLWSILTVILLCFLISHLWKFDRFKCLRWGSGRQSGGFKRVMTYTYLTSLPLLLTYGVTLTMIKYDEGYLVIPGYGIVPKPYQFWSQSNRDWITKLYIIFSMAWALELVSHLEELCFWLFLINASPAHKNWFRSMHFKCWLVGSLAAIVGLPLVTALTQSDPLRCEAWTFLIGSLGSLATTLTFIPVLFKFPQFVRRVAASGADLDVVIRLSTFHELNVIRVIFRFIFAVPFLILACDGIKHGTHHHLNESAVWTDLLGSLGAIGCIVSSVITIMIFFPRSIEKEAGFVSRQRSAAPSVYKSRNARPSRPQSTYTEAATPITKYPAPSYSASGDRDRERRLAATGGGVWDTMKPEGYSAPASPISPVTFAPPTQDLPIHPMVFNFTSPIDFMDSYDDPLVQGPHQSPA
ncbi:hypothetical protein BOTBODRAFT_34840 [Botryobasidium botryosum FD-172 SS1]|uniref:Uncharacterized protein n=1 Tax=Botryobasidium botryosum (strain FD-172 SS1) TaxID=930990 RepID=A0A067MK95_BOTB1|nr:hypothetical protein BOTBODRAFT_34840 [Botryobasidium botryosum FD-172 SS1]